MPKNKKPLPRKSVDSPEQKGQDMTRALCALALYLSSAPARNATTTQNAADFSRIIKKALHQKNDDVLYEALESLGHAPGAAYGYLKQAIEDIAEVVVITRDGAVATEINAFVIPLFLHTMGGLKNVEVFQDQEAFELLTQSLQAGGLESPQAQVVLVNHAYQLDEIDSITFSHLHEMVRDAHASMHDMRGAPASAIARSFGAPFDEPFAADDVAVELRFLLGFAMKAIDDPFYVVPADDAAIEAYFEAREQRFQDWSRDVTPLVRRCFGPTGREIAVHFLYQDVFHSGKERGIAEYFTLQMMSDLNYGLSEAALAPSATRAVIGPGTIADEKILRVDLYRISDDVLVASAEKPLAVAADLDTELLDVRDALAMIGVELIALTPKFDDDGVSSPTLQVIHGVSRQ